MDIAGISFNKNEIARYEKLAHVLLKYGFSDLIANSSLKSYIPNSYLNKHQEELSLTTYERIRMILEDLGPTYVKLGQIFSNREDMLPPGLIAELEKLQDNVPPIEGFQIKEALQKHLYNVNLDDEFIFIDEEPMASASISQVHKAQLRNGDLVILKIQRPNIEEVINADIQIMKKVASMLEKHNEEIAHYHPTRIIETFEESIAQELQFSNEIMNQKRFAKNFKDNPYVHVPKIYDGYSNKNVICMEYVDGIKLTDIDDLDKLGVNRKALASLGIDLYLKQVLEHGFFHADPHAGNLFYLPQHNQMCFIDFGMMGYISPKDRELLDELLMEFINENVGKLIKTIKKIAVKTDIPDEGKLEFQLQGLIDKYGDTTLDEMDMDLILPEFKEIMNMNEIVMPNHIYLLVRALVMIEGIGIKLDPEINVMENVEPYLTEILLRHYSPKRFFKNTIESAANFYEMIGNLPSDMREIVRKVKNGEIKIVHEIKDFDQFQITISKASNRLVLAIIIATLSISSSLLVMANMPPRIFDIPLLGVFGFVISGILGLMVVLSILKNKNY